MSWIHNDKAALSLSVSMRGSIAQYAERIIIATQSVLPNLQKATSTGALTAKRQRAHAYCHIEPTLQNINISRCFRFQFS